MREVFNFSVVHSARNVPRRTVQVIAGWLLASSIFYAGAATACLSHKPPMGDIIDVFVAGAVPGLLLTMVLRVARPDAVDQHLRRRLIGVSLAGSALVATIPLMTAGF